MSEHPRTILLCENTESIIATIVTSLEQSGHEVRLASQGERAWQAIRESSPDAVISADRLPGLTGLDLLTLLSGSGLRVPVILLTDDADHEAIAEALRMGAACAIPKVAPESDAILPPLRRALERVFHQADLEAENRTLLERLRRQREELEDVVAEQTRDLQAALARLQSLDRLKSDFLTLVSHEMRTPLSSILGFSEILDDGLYEDENELREILSYIRDSGRRLSRFVNDSLELFQWYSGRCQLQFERVLVRGWVGQAIEDVHSAADEREIELCPDVDPDLSIEGDATILEQALVRVLENAIKFSPQGGTIELQASGEGSRALVTVTDHGLGIDPSRVDSIFRPLEICGDLNHHSHGQGLGLALVKEAVEAHGGEVLVSSRGTGEGTSVCLDLPTRVPEDKRRSYAEGKLADPGPLVRLLGVA